jgi:hypothetical protein
VQRIVMGDVLPGVDVKPALPALFRRPRIPADRQRLQPAIRELDQVLLQRRDAEGVFDRVVGRLAIRAIGIDEPATVTAEEGGDLAGRLELRVIEIAKHCLLAGHLHGEIVMGALPGPQFFGMTPGAGRRTDIGDR